MFQREEIDELAPAKRSAAFKPIGSSVLDTIPRPDLQLIVVTCAPGKKDALNSSYAVKMSSSELGSLESSRWWFMGFCGLNRT
jgi:hypothetical protein